MTRRWLRRLAVLLLVCGTAGQATPSAWAAGPLRDNPRARQFFEVGAQAYAKGQYLLAIDAFEQAYALTERPGLLFSVAQAQQRQFRASGDEAHLLKAIEAYRKYLARQDGGEHRDEAQQSMNALLAVSARLHPRGSSESPARARVFGKLLLSSATPGAQLSVNGEPVDSVPTSLELPEAHYRVVASAKGFEPYAQDVVVVAGASVPLSVELKPLPAQLEVKGPAGAEVLVDRRSMGWLPLGRIVLAPGEHWVSLRKAGRQTRSTLARLERGETTHVELSLPTTLQRDAVWVALGGAVVAAGFSGTFAILAAKRDDSAHTLDTRHDEGTLTLQEGEQLNRDVAARDRFRSYALVGGVSALALLGGAAALYLLDTPSAPNVPDARASPTARNFRLLPLTGDAWGLAGTGRF